VQLLFLVAVEGIPNILETPPILLLKSYIWQGKPELIILCTKFDVASFNGCRNK